MTDDEREAVVRAFRQALEAVPRTPHDTTRTPAAAPSGPELDDETTLAAHPLPAMRAPEVSITNEVVKATTRESLRIMATETEKQTPLIKQAAAETALQTPMIVSAAKNAASGKMTTLITGAANFVGLVILTVIVGLSQYCGQSAPPAPPGYVLVPTSVLLQRGGAPAPPAPAPASPPPAAAPPNVPR